MTAQHFEPHKDVDNMKIVSFFCFAHTIPKCAIGLLTVGEKTNFDQVVAEHYKNVNMTTEIVVTRKIDQLSPISVKFMGLHSEL